MFMPISKAAARGIPSQGISNAGVVVGDNGVFVIDATAGPMHAKNFIFCRQESYR